MTWSGLASNACVRYGDVKDAVSGDELQWRTVDPGDLRSTSDGNADSYIWGEGNFDSYVSTDGSLSGNRRPTKADMEVARDWNPGTTHGNNTPGTPVASLNPTFCRMSCTLPAPSNAPPTWAESVLEYEVQRSVNGGAYAALTTRDYGTASITDTDLVTSSTYTYRIRLRSKANTSWYTAWQTSNTVTCTC